MSMKRWQGRYYAEATGLTHMERARRQDMERIIRWQFPPSEHWRAIFVAWKVSDLEAGAIARFGPGLYGLFQLSPEVCGFTPEQAWVLLSPMRNAACAYRLWQIRGWSWWEVEIPLEAFPTEEGQKE